MVFTAEFITHTGAIPGIYQLPEDLRRCRNLQRVIVYAHWGIYTHTAEMIVYIASWWLIMVGNVIYNVACALLHSGRILRLMTSRVVPHQRTTQHFTYDAHDYFWAQLITADVIFYIVVTLEIKYLLREY